MKQQLLLSEQSSLNSNNLFESRACTGWRLQITDKQVWQNWIISTALVSNIDEEKLGYQLQKMIKNASEVYN